MEHLGVEPTLSALKAQTDGGAGMVYKALYGDDIGCDDYMHQELADIVFNFRVQCRIAAPKLLRRVLNDMGANPQLEVAGDIVQATMAALADMDASEVYRALQAGPHQGLPGPRGQASGASKNPEGLAGPREFVSGSLTNRALA
ncbi:MAG: N-acetylmuramidase [Betaproteobacteria bacterium]|nr:N-acetylmuramidase [Betaproteobacteria bacterium]